MKDKLKKIFKNRYTLFVILLLVVVLVIYLFMDARAYISVNVEGNSQSIISFSSCASVSMTDAGEYITLQNAYPVSDNVGVNTDSYEFSIKNECNTDKTMMVYLVVNSDSTINDKYINTYLNSSEIKSLTSYDSIDFFDEYLSQYTSLTNNNAKKIYTLGEYTVSANDQEDLSLKLWIDKEAVDVENQTFNASIVVADSEIVE